MPGSFDPARDMPVIASMFVLRLLVPAVVLMALGWLLWRFFAPHDEQERHVSFTQFVLRVRGRLEPIRLPHFSARMIMLLLVLSLLWIAAIGFLIARYFFGLGAATALNDYMPWGLWIAFKLACVACAAGGFTFAATVYVFRLEQYRPIVRTAVLTGLIGYSTFIISLIFDLGRWYNIWHPVVMWNPHSVMFEVAWCVMLYTTVLLFEFSPAPLERLGLVRAQRWVHKVTIPLVILGVILSTLHQSSLGSLYLIMPVKLDALWWTPFLPVFFFTSAVAAGIAMMMVVPCINASVFKCAVQNKMLSSLAHPAAFVLSLYLVLKVIDYTWRGVWGSVLTLTPHSVLLWLELGLGVLLPILLLASSRAQAEASFRFRAALLVIGGTVLNRFNVAFFGFTDFLSSVDATYVPSLGEWVITLALLTGAFAVYALAVKLLPVLPEGPVAVREPADLGEPVLQPAIAE